MIVLMNVSIISSHLFRMAHFEAMGLMNTSGTHTHTHWLCFLLEERTENFLGNHQ